MGVVVNLHAQRESLAEDPHIVIDLNRVGVKEVHVFPRAYFERWLAGELVEDIPPDVMRAIVHDWLKTLDE